MQKLLILLLALLSVSCLVPKKQFDELLAEKVKMEADMIDLKAAIKATEHQRDSLVTATKHPNNKNDLLTNQLNTANLRLQELQAAHDKLSIYYNNALSNSGKMSRDMKEQHERLMALQETLQETSYNNQLLEDSLQLREARVAELEQIVAESQHAIKTLKENLSAALLDFEKSDLTIEQRNGNIYVSLSEQLLFKSSSIQVDSKGKKALKQLASVLKATPDIHILIEGHTDNVPIASKSKYMQDNWDLSVLRATSIVKILIHEGVNPINLTPAGKGAFVPVAKNDTPNHRALNRRIELIITPNLDKLFAILEQNQSN